MSPTNHFDDGGMLPWSLADIYADLCCRGEISKLLDVSPFRVEKWIVRREQIKSPHPIRRIGGMDLYSKQEWQDWYARWQEKHGRDSRWIENTKPHGSGQPFFEYFND